VTYSQEQRLHWLLDYARRITNDLRPCQPVDLENLIKQESISLERDGDPGVRGPQGLLEADPCRGLVIRIRQRTVGSPGLTVRERFTVAHELGHSLLIKQFSWNPLAGDDFHACERLCNLFAGALLVPDSVLTKIEIKSAADTISSVLFLSRVYQVSRHVAARRLRDCYGNISLLSGAEAVNRKGQRIIKVSWSEGRIFGEVIHPMTHLSVSSPVAELIFPLVVDRSRKAKFIQEMDHDTFVCRLKDSSFLLSVVSR